MTQYQQLIQPIQPMQPIVDTKTVLKQFNTIIPIEIEVGIIGKSGPTILNII